MALPWFLNSTLRYAEEMQAIIFAHKIAACMMWRTPSRLRDSEKGSDFHIVKTTWSSPHHKVARIANRLGVGHSTKHYRHTLSVHEWFDHGTDAVWLKHFQ
jgi:hypothetical protein